MSEDNISERSTKEEDVASNITLASTPAISEVNTPGSRDTNESVTSPAASDITIIERSTGGVDSTENVEIDLHKQLRVVKPENAELKEHQRSVALSAIKKVRRHEQMMQTQAEEIPSLRKALESVSKRESINRIKEDSI